MKKRLAVGIIFSALFTGLRARAQTFPLEYKLLPEQRVLSRPIRLTAKSERPDFVGAEPEYKAKPLYCLFPFGVDGKEKPYLLVLAKSKEELASYDLLYIDADRDGDIGEERVYLTRTLSKLPTSTVFDVTLKVGRKQVSHQFEVSLLPSDQETRNSSIRTGIERILPQTGQSAKGWGVAVRDKGAWLGSFILNGRQLEIMLWDAKPNGIYNEPMIFSKDMARTEQEGDRFFSEPLTDMIPDFSKVHNYPALFEAGGKLYDVSITPDGSSISFSPLKGPYGTIETSSDRVRLIMLTCDGRSYNAVSQNRNLLVPVGDVYAPAYVIKDVDQAGIEWTLTGVPRRFTKLTIEAGKTTILQGGPPVRFMISSNSGRKVQAGSVIKLVATLQDCAKRQVRIGRMNGLARWPSKASFIIKNDNALLAVGDSKAG